MHFTLNFLPRSLRASFRSTSLHFCWVQQSIIRFIHLLLHLPLGWQCHILLWIPLFILHIVFYPLEPAPNTVFSPHHWFISILLRLIWSVQKDLALRYLDCCTWVLFDKIRLLFLEINDISGEWLFREFFRNPLIFIPLSFLTIFFVRLGFDFPGFLDLLRFSFCFFVI